MKHQIFLLSLFCFFTVSAMENQSKGSLENSRVVADKLQWYADVICRSNSNVDSQVLSSYIDAVRRSGMTNQQRDKAIALIYSEQLLLIERLRQDRIRMLRGEEGWSGYECSQKRRKIN